MRLAPSHPHNFRNRPICPQRADDYRVRSQRIRRARLEARRGRLRNRARSRARRTHRFAAAYGLGKRGIDSVFIEGGATLAACALEAGIVNHVQAFIAPKIFAGVGAPSPLGGTGVNKPYQAWTLSATTVERLGDDVLIEGDIVAAENAAPKEDACSQD